MKKTMRIKQIHSIESIVTMEDLAKIEGSAFAK
jgi:hypothetical protein